MIQLVANPPINAIAYSFGALTMFIYAIRGFYSYRQTHNPLAQIYVSVGLTLGLSFFWWGIPPLFSTNPHLLIYGQYLADSFLQLCFVAMARLLWFFGFRDHLKFRYLAIPIILWGIPLVASDILYSTVTIIGDIAAYHDAFITLVLKSIIYIAVPWPVGYFYMKQGLKQPELLNRLKLISMGLVYVLISAFAVLDNLNGGADTQADSIGRIVIFALFLLITVWPLRNTTPTAPIVPTASQ